MRLYAISCLILVSAVAQARESFIAMLQNSARVWTWDSLALGLYETCRACGGAASEQEIKAWANLLKSQSILKADGSVAAGIYVREIALTCLEELTGESFYPSIGAETPMREILSTTVNGEVERFQIVAIATKDLPAIQESVCIMLNGMSENEHRLTSENQALKAMVERLLGRVADLEARINQNSGNTSKSPSSDMGRRHRPEARRGSPGLADPSHECQPRRGTRPGFHGLRNGPG